MSVMEASITEPVRANFRKAWAPQEDQVLQREAGLQCVYRRDHRKELLLICIGFFSAKWKP